MAAPNDNHRFSILIINPNTSTHMTNALKPILESLDYADIHFDYFTAPSSESVTLPDGRIINGVPSINSGEDSITSALHCRPFVEALVPRYDAFLVACYSAHPLVGMLREAITKYEQTSSRQDSAITEYRKKYVTGIFEASVLTSFSLVSSFHLMGDANFHKAQAKDTFGIVTTGSIWRDELTRAVTDMIVNSGDSGGSTARFAGVETTGLTAGELHTTPAEEVRRRISDATERLIKSTSHPVSAICMGCAGMAGMEEAVRDGCIRAYGERQGRRVRIVDGVVAGAGMLVTACKAGF
jgi:Asp/Glu/hydantoin racemase